MNSKTTLQAVLKEICFDPRKPGPLSTIVSANNADYLVSRAQEALRDAERFTGVEKRSRVRDTCSILAYAMTLMPKAEDQCNRCKHRRDMHTMIGVGCSVPTCDCNGFVNGA